MIINISNHPIYNYQRHVDTEECSFLYDAMRRFLKITVIVNVESNIIQYQKLKKTFTLTASDEKLDNQPLIDNQGEKVWKYICDENCTRKWDGIEYRIFNQLGEKISEDELEVNPNWNVDNLLSEFEYFSQLKPQNIVINNMLQDIVTSADKLKRFD
jgi:hypothetical protein